MSKEAYTEKRKQWLDDIAFVMSNSQGRRLMYSLLEQAGLAGMKRFESTFTGNSRSHFLEGKRAMGLGVQKDIFKSGYSSYRIMMDENEKDVFN